MRRPLQHRRRAGPARERPPGAPALAASGAMSVLEARPVYIADFLLGAVHATKPAARRRSVDLRCLWEPQIGVVLVDAPSMHELLCGLLSHAVARRGPGDAVMVSAEQLGDEVRFSITESGGHEQAARIEEPAWLPMEQVLAAHGGRIWLDSDPDWGDMCCFTVLSTPRASA